jgi:hypothetical protein
MYAKAFLLSKPFLIIQVSTKELTTVTLQSYSFVIQLIRTVHVTMELKVHHCDHKRPPINNFVSHFNPNHIIIVYFLKFILISPFCLFIPRVVHTKILFTFLAPHVGYMLLSHVIYFDVIILILFGIVKTAINFIMLFSSLTSYFISPTS